MGYNYRQDGMPDYHLDSSDIAPSDADIHDQSETVSSPNPSTSFWKGMGNIMGDYGNSVVNNGLANTNKGLLKMAIVKGIKSLG